LLDMILEEGAPSLRRGFMAARHVFADAALSDLDGKFEQFAMDAGCTSARIVPAHLADQMSDLMRNDGSAGLAAAHLPGPEQAEASAMPRYDRFRPDDGQRWVPLAPEAGETDTQQAIPRELISRVLLRTSEAHRPGGAAPGSRAPGRHVNAESRAELRGMT
jgi:hypothetical protein